MTWPKDMRSQMIGFLLPFNQKESYFGAKNFRGVISQTFLDFYGNFLDFSVFLINISQLTSKVRFHRYKLLRTTKNH